MEKGIASSMQQASVCSKQNFSCCEKHETRNTIPVLS